MRASLSRDRPARWWVAAALLLAVASLPFGHALAFDASAWVVWGREVWSLDLRTVAGPSWKPFPVLLTAPFAALGDGAAAAWLVVARAGALLAVVGAARLAARAAGPWAALVAVATLLLSPWWLLNGALGNADPILGALVVWAILATTDERPRLAFALTVLGALIRPEVWPFVAAHAAWLLRRGELRPGPALAAGAGVFALWVVPDLLSSGLRSTTGATGTASAGSAANTSFPFGAVLVDLGRQAPWVGLVAALAGAWVLRGRRAAARPAPWLAVVLAYALLVAVMAQAGFAGNPRYLVPGLVLLAAVTGTVVAVAPAGWRLTRPFGVLPARAGVAVLVVAALLVTGVPDVRSQVTALRHRAEVRRGLFAAVDARGGPGAVRGPVRSGSPDLRALVAEALHVAVTETSRRSRPGDLVARPAVGGRWTLRRRP